MQEALLEIRNRIKHHLRENLIYFNVHSTSENLSFREKADQAFKECGFGQLGNFWLEPPRDEALAWLRFSLQWSLAFQEEFMSEQAAHELAAEILQLPGELGTILCSSKINLEKKEADETDEHLPRFYLPPFTWDDDWCWEWATVLISNTKLVILATRYPMIY